VAAAYAAYFADSSALVKRYVQETGTSWVRRLTRRSPSTVIHFARITAVEVTSAVARRRKGRMLTSAKASERRFLIHRFLSGRRRVHWGLSDLLAFLLPFAVWVSLMNATSVGLLSPPNTALATAPFPSGMVGRFPEAPISFSARKATLSDG